MNNVKFTNRQNDGTISYTVVSLSDQRTLGQVTNIQPGVWVARYGGSRYLGEYPTRAAAGQGLWSYFRELSR